MVHRDSPSNGAAPHYLSTASAETKPQVPEGAVNPPTASFLHIFLPRQRFRNWDFPWSIEKATHVPPGPAFDSSFSKSEGRSVSPLQTVMVQCGEQNLLVSVQMDLFGTRHLIKAADLTLGSTGCWPTGVYSQNHTVLFHYGLHECDSTVKMTDDLLIYTTHLYYRPSHIGGVIVRTSGAVVPIQCHYPRKRTVSSNAIEPTWVPFSSTKEGEGHLSFSLRLMTADWSAEHTSNIYHLGDLIHIEASVMTMNHMPLRLYIDRCVATLSPDQASTPRYNIIDFNGCLLDSRDEDSFSSFVSPRDHLDKLQFKLDAFRFFEDDRDLIFITCHLKVAAADQRPDSVNKACSFQKPANRWSLVTELDLSLVEGSNEMMDNLLIYTTHLYYKPSRIGGVILPVGQPRRRLLFFVSPRDHLDKLQFKLDAFRFFEDDRDLIFITCHLKVAAADQRPDSVNKACSFQKTANRWSLVTELDLSMVEGSNEVCACYSEPVWEGEVSLGPLIILDADLKDLVHSMGSEAEEIPSSSPGEVLLAVTLAAGALISATLVAAFFFRKHT
uniref:zona pellucida sperm-binding protein 3-like n=1 Tax=Pristiophorus japonicus TaxID=55135 RepID=UPI00398E8909